MAFLDGGADVVGGAAAEGRLAFDQGVLRLGALHCYYTSDPNDDTDFVHTLEEAALGAG